VVSSAAAVRYGAAELSSEEGDSGRRPERRRETPEMPRRVRAWARER
jgi:hypothetical protein